MVNEGQQRNECVQSVPTTVRTTLPLIVTVVVVAVAVHQFDAEPDKRTLKRDLSFPKMETPDLTDAGDGRSRALLSTALDG